MSDMTRLIVIAIGILLVLGAAELAVRASPDLVPDSWYWPTAEAEMKYRHLATEGRDPHVIILGSSFMEAAVDPDLISGIEVYNMAMPFSSFGAMRVWLEEVIFLKSDPEAILIGLPVWSDRGPEVDISDALSKAIARTEETDDSSLRLWSLRGALGLMDRSLARGRLTENELWTQSGHQIGYRQWSADRSTWRRRAPAVMDSEKRVALARLIEEATSSEDEVYLLIEPIAALVGPSQVMVERYVDDIRAIAREAGVDVWEAPMWFWDDDNYVDGIHFNAGATSSFSDFVGDRISDVIGPP